VRTGLSFQRVGQPLDQKTEYGQQECAAPLLSAAELYSVQMNIYDRAAKNKEKVDAERRFFSVAYFGYFDKVFYHGDTEAGIDSNQRVLDRTFDQLQTGRCRYG